MKAIREVIVMDDNDHILHAMKWQDNWPSKYFYNNMHQMFNKMYGEDNWKTYFVWD